MWPNPQFPEDLVTFTEEILNEKHFLCSVTVLTDGTYWCVILCYHTDGVYMFNFSLTRKSRKTDSFYAVLISHFWGSTECWRQCGVRQYGDCKNYIEHCETAKPLSYTEKTYCEPITLKKYTEKIHHLKNLAIHFL